MAKFGYYGVYGKNSAGVFTSYDRVLSAQRYIDGMKLKKFVNRNEAVAFIVNGLCNDYEVISEQELDIDLLYENTNWSYSLDDLRTCISIAVVLP